ncbi:Mu transposase C-terminal domain-containing protein [Streptomyces sp. NPDC059443]|uniref:Mu transposase C-terminal domain-containing protein n=1 Tax=unclassified Streptomyces TaxID=2593676 RepID=UPI0036C6205D
MMAKASLSPNEMWAALIEACGYLPVPLTGRDYVELLPTRWQQITDRGIRIDHRTYDAGVLNPHRGHSSGVQARGGKWEVHHNPHDARQVWVRLPDGELCEIPWIHHDYVDQPFSDHTWQHLKVEVGRRGDTEQYEADLAEALSDILTRARTGSDSRSEAGVKTSAGSSQSNADVPARPATLEGVITPVPDHPEGPEDGRHPERQAADSAPASTDAESLDDLDEADDSAEDQDWTQAAAAGGFGVYDAQREAEQW